MYITGNAVDRVEHYEVGAEGQDSEIDPGRTRRDDESMLSCMITGPG